MVLVGWNVNFAFWVRKAVESFKQGLVGHPHSNREDSAAKRNMLL